MNENFERLNAEAMEAEFHREIARIMRATVWLSCIFALLVIVFVVWTIGRALANAAWVEVHGGALAAQYYDVRTEP